MLNPLPLEPLSDDITPEMAKQALAEMDSAKNSQPQSTAPANDEITPEMAQKALDEIKSTQAKSVEKRTAELRQKLAKETGFLESTMVVAGRRAERLVQGAKQLGLKGAELVGLAKDGSAKAYTDKTNEKNKFWDDTVDALAAEHPVANVAGEVLGTAPLGAFRGLSVVKGAVGPTTGIVARIGRGAAQGAATGAQQGALYGAVNYDPTNESRASNIVQNAALGTVIGAPVGGFVGGISKAGTRAGVATAEGAADTADYVSKGRELGIENMTEGLASGDAKAQAFEAGIRNGLPNKAQETLLTREGVLKQEMVDAADKLVGEIPGQSLPLPDSGKLGQETLRKIAKKEKVKVNGLYEKLKSSPEYNAPIEMKNAKEVYSDIIENYADIKLPPSVNKFFKKIGAAAEQKISLQDVIANPKLKEAYDAQDLVEPFIPTLKDAIDIAKTIGKSTSGSKDAAAKSAGARLSQAIYDSIDSIAENPAFSESLRASVTQARNARKQLSAVFSGKDIVQDIIAKKAIDTNKIDPSVIVNKILNKELTATNLKKIKSALELGGEEGISTYNNLRQSALQKIFSDSTDIVNDVPTLNFKKLSKMTNKLGTESMKEIIGDPKAYVKFNNLVHILGRFENGKSVGGKMPPENLIKSMIFDKTLRSKIPGFVNAVMGWLEGRGKMKQLKQNFKIGESTEPMLATAGSNRPAQIAENFVNPPNLAYNIGNIPRGGIVGLSNYQSRDNNGNYSS